MNGEHALFVPDQFEHNRKLAFRVMDATATFFERPLGAKCQEIELLKRRVRALRGVVSRKQRELAALNARVAELEKRKP